MSPRQTRSLGTSSGSPAYVSRDFVSSEARMRQTGPENTVRETLSTCTGTATARAGDEATLARLGEPVEPVRHEPPGGVKIVESFHAYGM